jgi:dolichol-phosphate mannosyltransferase
MKSCIIIPTLNEERNIEKIFYKIRKIFPKFDVLFIDDESTDLSQKVILKLKQKYKSIKYIFRKKKGGIGSAHKDGFKYVFKNGYDIVITMDCDGTHDPKYIKKMLIKARYYDYIITSRFKKSGLISDWPLHRKLLTIIRHILIKFFLKMNYDASGAFRCFYLKKVRLKDLLSAKNNEYAYFWEITHHLKKKEYKIYEVPVKLTYRKLGESKMKLSHIMSSLYQLIKIYISK